MQAAHGMRTAEGGDFAHDDERPDSEAEGGELGLAGRYGGRGLAARGEPQDGAEEEEDAPGP